MLRLNVGRQSLARKQVVSPTAQGATRADPSALPLVGGQLKNLTAYAALNVPGLAADTSYADPVTGALVWKLTSASVPQANPYTAHEYSEGPLQISLEWAPGQYTIVLNVAFGGKWLVDFRRGVGTSNWRALHFTVSQLTFSRDPATPQIAYVTSGTQLRRYNTATNTFADEAPFPANFSSNGWLQQDKNDRWFVGLGTTAETVLAWDRTTGVLRTQSVSGLDEPYLEKDGRYVVMNASPTTSPLWDLQTDTVTSITAPGSSNWTHVPALRGYFVTTDVNTGAGITPQYRVDPTGADTAQFTTLGGYYPDAHGCAQWVQTDAELGAGGLIRQWWLRSTFNWSFVATGTGGVSEGIEFLRLDGTERRLVGHHYSVNPTNGADNYWSVPKATMSADGKLVVFSSNMNDTSRSDVFVVEVPVG